VAGPEWARLAGVPDRAVLVEDHREGKEHQESEQVCTSFKFGTAFGSGRMDLECPTH
jgi:hypothetical protein